MIKQKVDIHLSKEEIAEIIAEYIGADVKDVVFEYQFHPLEPDEISVRIKKELTFPGEKQTITVPYSPWYTKPVDTSKGPHDYPNPLYPSVTWTSDLKCITNTGTGENITSTGTSISEESIRTSIDDIRAKWTKDDALATSETSKANDWK